MTKQELKVMQTSKRTKQWLILFYKSPLSKALDDLTHTTKQTACADPPKTPVWAWAFNLRNREENGSFKLHGEVYRYGALQTPGLF